MHLLLSCLNRALTLASDRARAKNNGATMMGEACDDLKFQRQDRILHRHDDPFPLEKAHSRSGLRSRGVQAPPPLTSQAIMQMQRRRRYAMVAASEKGAGICSECYIVLSLTLLEGGSGRSDCAPTQ